MVYIDHTCGDKEQWIVMRSHGHTLSARFLHSNGAMLHEACRMPDAHWIVSACEEVTQHGVKPAVPCGESHEPVGL